MITRVAATLVLACVAWLSVACSTEVIDLQATFVATPEGTTTPAPQATSSEAPPPTSPPTAAPTPAATPRSTTAPTPVPTPVPTPTPSTSAGLAPSGPTQVATVLRVIDGDTIEVEMNGRAYRVRYIGIDTPETVHPNRPVEWLGPEASAANAALVEGRTLVLEKDVSETDRYGRLLRYIWLQDVDGWVFVNLELLRLGLASVTTYPPDVKYVEALYLPAQRQAQAEGRGIWGVPP